MRSPSAPGKMTSTRRMERAAFSCGVIGDSLAGVTPAQGCVKPTMGFTLEWEGEQSRSGGAREHQACPGQAEHVVGAVLDQRGARVAEDFFDRILLAEAVAAQQLKRVAGDLKCRLRAEGLRGNRVFHRGYRGVGVVGYRRAREQAARLDLGEHFEQLLLHELMLADRLATLDALPGVIERNLEGRTSHSGED